MDTPVLFLVFNRYDSTKKVFEAIRSARPCQLFVAADGPRVNKEGESDKCEAVRNLIIDSIDWPCEVYTLFRSENIGSGKAISQAINWFFSHVDKGIILEDDCLPDNTFFNFAGKMLNYYEHEEKIMHISGTSLQCGIKRGKGSYHLSRISATWGWATWRRAWNKYSFDFFFDTNDQITNVLKRNLKNDEDVLHFINEFDRTKNHEVDAWDYQWFYTLLRNDAICVTPQYNLIQNLGFNDTGTHTFSAPHWYKYLVDKPIDKLVYLDRIEVNSNADSFYMSLVMGRRTIETIYVKLLYKLKNINA